METSEKLTFRQWCQSEVWTSIGLVSGGTLVGWILSLGSFLYLHRPSPFSFPAFDETLKTPDARYFLGALSAVQAAACFLMTVMTPRPIPENQNKQQAVNPITVEASRRIQVMVLVLYVTLGLLYSVMSFFSLATPHCGETQPCAEYHWLTVTETFTATALFFLYLELSKLTVGDQVSSISDSNQTHQAAVPNHAKRTILFLACAALSILLSVLSFWFSSPRVGRIIGVTFGCLSGLALIVLVMDKSRPVSASRRLALAMSSSDTFRHKILFTGFAIVLITLSILSFYFHRPTVGFIVTIIVACLSGVTLALVVGRLGSMYINPGTATLFLLYLYVVIQPFAALFERPIVSFIVTSAAVPLKILLWLVFVWAFTTGKLWEYVQGVRQFLQRQGRTQHRVPTTTT